MRLSSTIVSNVARAMYRVLKLGGLVALLFDGKLSDREVGDVVFRVASRHPEYPAFIESVKAFHKGFIDLEEAMTLFKSVGFVDLYIFARHRIFFDVPDLDDTNAYWGIWRSGVPRDHWGEIRDEIISEFKFLSEEQGFKNTSYLIIGVGGRPVRARIA